MNTFSPSGSSLERDSFYYMEKAYRIAVEGEAQEEVPVGAIIVRKGEVIAKAHNQIETLNDPTAHAEIIAITQACSSLESKILDDADIYVTLEPCPMCAMAIVLAKIRKLVFATPDPRTGACGSILNIVQDTRLNHQVEVESGIMQAECSELLKSFFGERR